jgi:hypothetical protein
MPWRHKGEWGYTSTHSSHLYYMEKPASCPSRLFPVKTNHGNHWIGGWVGCRADLNLVDKSLVPAGNRTLHVCLYVDEIHSSVGIVTGLEAGRSGNRSLNFGRGNRAFRPARGPTKPPGDSFHRNRATRAWSEDKNAWSCPFALSILVLSLPGKQRVHRAVP